MDTAYMERLFFEQNTILQEILEVLYSIDQKLDKDTNNG